MDKCLQVILNRVFPNTSEIELKAEIEYTQDAYQICVVKIIKNGKCVDKFNLPMHTVTELIALDKENKL